jgi:hypothetical protein
MSDTVECFRCDRKVRLRADGTYPQHGTTRRGVIVNECPHSGEVHERHSGSFRIVTRNPTRWLCECLCGETFVEDTYDAVDAAWSTHRAASKAAAS